RVGRVADLPCYQTGLAGMAHAGPAGPAHRHVAGFGELEQARVALVTAGGQAAARERDLRAGTRRPGRLVRRHRGRRRDPGRQPWPGPEDLGHDLAAAETEL